MVKVRYPKRKTKTQSYWQKKVKHIKLKDLLHVRTFASGGSAHVSVVQLRGYPNSAFAMKTMQKSKITKPAERCNVLSEKQILGQVRSDFILKLYRTFKDDEYLHLLTEYLPGGELFDLERGRVSEDDARFYIACVVEALDCLREQNIVHNDIKSSNLVLDAAGYAKLIDFGFALKLEPGKKSHGFYYGTVAYSPPELHRGRDTASDLWSLGVLLYRIVAGVTPFVTDDNDDTTLVNIRKGIDSIQFPRSEFSEEAEDITRKLCQYEPDKRLGYGSIDEIRQHRWFDGFDWGKLRDRTLTAPIVPKVRNVVDTQNFSRDVSDSDSDVEKDESDWDRNF